MTTDKKKALYFRREKILQQATEAFVIGDIKDVPARGAIKTKRFPLYEMEGNNILLNVDIKFEVASLYIYLF